MIPKIIHLCWLSGDAFPKDIAECLESWKQYLNDYEVWLWGKKPQDCLRLNIVEKNFDIDSVLWCKQAFEAKKYAFAADYIRLYALYNYGGIYMDSDVLVYKSFNDLLHLPYFIGEDRTHCFEPAVVGCEPGMPWIKHVLDHYKGRSFIKNNGKLDITTLPVVFINRLRNNYQFRKITGVDDFQQKDNVIDIFPYDYFNSRDHVGSRKYANSYCSHHYAGSWEKKQSQKKTIIKALTPRFLANCYYSIMFGMVYKKQLELKQIPYNNQFV